MKTRLVPSASAVLPPDGVGEDDILTFYTNLTPRENDFVPAEPAGIEHIDEVRVRAA